MVWAPSGTISLCVIGFTLGVVTVIVNSVVTSSTMLMSDTGSYDSGITSTTHAIPEWTSDGGGVALLVLAQDIYVLYIVLTRYHASFTQCNCT